MNDIYPVTVVQDRYNGTYSGGKWTAWNVYPGGVPVEIFQDDVTCNNFFAETDIVYGAGGTPDAAVNNLKIKLRRWRWDHGEKEG